MAPMQNNTTIRTHKSAPFMKKDGKGVDKRRRYPDAIPGARLQGGIGGTKSIGETLERYKSSAGQTVRNLLLDQRPLVGSPAVPPSSGQVYPTYMGFSNAPPSGYGNLGLGNMEQLYPNNYAYDASVHGPTTQHVQEWLGYQASVSAPGIYLSQTPDAPVQPLVQGVGRGDHSWMTDTPSTPGAGQTAQQHLPACVESSFAGDARNFETVPDHYATQPATIGASVHGPIPAKDPNFHHDEAGLALFPVIQGINMRAEEATAAPPSLAQGIARQDHVGGFTTPPTAPEASAQEDATALSSFCANGSAALQANWEEFAPSFDLPEDFYSSAGFSLWHSLNEFNNGA